MTSEKNLGGRPTKFTAELCAALIDDISHCVPYELAAYGNGIGPTALYSWLNQGYADLENGIDSEFARFSKAIKGTENKRIRRHIDTIDEMPKGWQAHAWILERRWWKHFSQNAAAIEFNERLQKLEQDARKGDDNGKEVKQVDSESDKTPRCPP